APCARPCRRSSPGRSCLARLPRAIGGSRARTMLAAASPRMLRTPKWRNEKGSEGRGARSLSARTRERAERERELFVEEGADAIDEALLLRRSGAGFFAGRPRELLDQLA